MSKYINADELKRYINAVYFNEKFKSEAGKAANMCGQMTLEYIDSLPSADVAEVVMCKDCKYGKKRLKYNGILPWCDMYCVAHREFIQRNDFCSYGELE